MDEKRRQIDHLGQRPWTTWYQKDWLTNPDPGNISTGFAPPVTSLETTQSRGHAWPLAEHVTTDVGGNFTTSKVKSLTTYDDQFYYGTGAGWTYYGQELPINPKDAITNALNSVKPSSDLVLAQKGTTAIARCIPTNPVADAATFIGEIKSGLPKMIGKGLLKSKFKDYREVGSEYLNIEFGWKPILADLQKFGRAATESEKILNQLTRDSGKNIRRKFTFPDEVVTETTKTNNRLSYVNGLSLYSGCFRSVGGSSLTVTNTVTTKTWFSGCFTYYVNLGTTLPDKYSRAAAYAKKLGAGGMTPETAWNLAPWSWAVDWEGTTGDVIHNLVAFSQDGLVMRYGYIMQQKTAVRSYTLSSGGRLNRSPVRDLHMTVIAESKTRRRATPFGFGFDMTALTGRQSAILGALGIARGPRHL